jgi:preprotein translocase subunit SecG
VLRDVDLVQSGGKEMKKLAMLLAVVFAFGVLGIGCGKKEEGKKEEQKKEEKKEGKKEEKKEG